MDKLTYFQETEEGLTGSFQFDDFTKAWAFMNEVALHAERLQHHPEWSNTYNTVRINLCTHDEGSSITHRDYELALIIEKIRG